LGNNQDRVPGTEHVYGIWRKVLRRISFIIFVSTFLTACERATPLSVQEKKVVDRLTNRMQTHCMGRYILELPRELHIRGALSINDVKISAVPEDLRSFNAMLVRRDFKLKNTKSSDEYPFFYKDGRGTTDHTRYFISRERPDRSPGFRKIEAYKWDNGYAITVEVRANDFTDPDQTSDPLVRKIGTNNDVPVKLARVLDYLDRVQGRADTDIPSEPGVCFFGGFVKGPASETEKVWSSYSLLHHPDVLFKLSTDTEMEEDTTLLQRSRSLGAHLQYFSAKTLRRGVVDLPGLPAEEWLTTTKTIKDVPGHYFTLEANSQTARWRSPFVMLDLQTGLTGPGYQPPPATSSLNDNEALAVWDAVSRTLRARPNGF